MQGSAAQASTTVLSAFEWALIVGTAGIFTVALGFFLARMIRTLDRLDDAVVALRETLAKEYVTKQDLREALQDLKESLLGRRRRVEDCSMEGCPIRFQEE